mgnify:CR=1 FL=1
MTDTRAKRYTLGYDWGKVEAFVCEDNVTLQCLSRLPPGMIYETTISVPDGEINWERSYIPDGNRSAFLPPKDCENKSELRPNVKNLLSILPENVSGAIKKAFGY